MDTTDTEYFTISEVSVKTGVPEYSLRQWEKKVPALRPERTRSRIRRYTLRHINIVRELNHLITAKKLPLEAAAIELSRILNVGGRPENREQALAMVDKIEAEARAMLRLLRLR